MKMAMVFLMGFLCSAVVFLVAAQAPSQFARYQLVAPNPGGGTVYQLDMYTGRLYERMTYTGVVFDLGTLDQPLDRQHGRPSAKSGATKTAPPQ